MKWCKHYFFKYILYYILLHQVTGESVIQQLHIIFRHGERAPTDTFPNDPYINYSWPGGWGQLTNNGKLQMYDLGKSIRTEYKNFIPDVFWHKDVNITSSYSERCRMSGQLFLSGLYPPVGSQIWNEELLWQPVAVRYLPRTEDTNIVMKVPCAKYDAIFKELRQSPTILALEHEHEELKKYLTKHTGSNVTNMEDVESIYNTLEIEKLQNFTRPSWVNDTMLATMRELAARNLAFYSEVPYMKKVKGGMFLNNMIKTMENSLNKTDVTKLYLYAAHDLTIVHILRSLNLIETLKPDFGATLIFELNADSSIKITYRNFWKDTPKEYYISQCELSCPLQKFKSLLSDILPTDYTKECALEQAI
ncbi:prostatic acid phosphatase-like [Diabrotica undecimpunctata]|uniref:prostatic acid phosphatase-like n=1 Tax=Diabrotica undecimpunctata TaxID=50387 RepID=UPI003B6328B8